MMGPLWCVLPVCVPVCKVFSASGCFPPRTLSKSALVLISCPRTLPGHTVPPLHQQTQQTVGLGERGLILEGGGAGWALVWAPGGCGRLMECSLEAQRSPSLAAPGGMAAIDGASMKGWIMGLSAGLGGTRSAAVVADWVLHQWEDRLAPFVPTFCRPRTTKSFAGFWLKAVNNCDLFRPSSRYQITGIFLCGYDGLNEAAGSRPAALTWAPQPPETRAHWAKLHKIRCCGSIYVSCGWTFSSGPQREGELQLL